MGVPRVHPRLVRVAWRPGNDISCPNAVAPSLDVAPEQDLWIRPVTSLDVRAGPDRERPREGDYGHEPGRPDRPLAGEGPGKVVKNHPPHLPECRAVRRQGVAWKTVRSAGFGAAPFGRGWNAGRPPDGISV